MSALAGRRIVVTRPVARSAALGDALAARGAIVVAFPVIETATLGGGALDAALRHRARYDWIALTSAAAVDAVAARCAALALPLPLEPVAAVGSATAAAAREAGLTVRATPATFRGGELAAAMGPLAGRRVLLPAATIARPETAAALRAAGALVTEVQAYETRTVTPSPEALAMLALGADAVTFASPSAITAFRDVAGRAGAAVLATAAVACIGPTTAAAARALGIVVHIAAAPYTAVGLATALERWFSAVRPEGATR